jgi:hypothetical protein
MKVILHIGLNKTGTSSLQNFFHKNEEFLSRNDIIYPKSGRKIGNKIDSSHQR